ncbi:homoserine/homoserine lactone efflux protein [Photobacterium sanguinicancri]|uniref:Homoserine/homoserine lactone efflux protein n=1 Tax=Photobacterium sanguinicancri TaxID=875932 RepID=A0AAW7Y4J2_9GAMM|nr:homoserine/homoserine lactone efflux protein [Photobacterium sanguinicancri]KXI23942.1 homoserine transporter [Photobacterium sanguinicancri]MDO6499470.1 homoserine/homoserine lactone efflux protein [Photobacterium sanguinicancri]MDO6543211.1 homoserine/homoserine lactone efflux protein [Photobacterium sanguinicancri]OZS44700.1 homoserine/homoserine lactone efflux protein [Photobacterium sanguinicancri]
MSVDIWLAYLATAIVFSFAPGSGTVNSISNGMVYGFRKSLSSIIGLQVGLTCHIILVGVGLGALVAQSATAFTVIKWVGALYLIILGIQKWRERATFDLNPQQASVSSSRLFRQAILVNLTNPKSIVFLVALFPQFIQPSAPQLPQLLILGVTTVMVDMCVMLGYVTLASRLSGYIRSERIMGALNRVFGSMFIGCGALLASARA